jgi:hypothetical protein
LQCPCVSRKAASSRKRPSQSEPNELPGVFASSASTSSLSNCASLVSFGGGSWVWRRLLRWDEVSSVASLGGGVGPDKSPALASSTSSSTSTSLSQSSFASLVSFGGSWVWRRLPRWDDVSLVTVGGGTGVPVLLVGIFRRQLLRRVEPRLDLIFEGCGSSLETGPGHVFREDYSLTEPVSLVTTKYYISYFSPLIFKTEENICDGRTLFNNDSTNLMFSSILLSYCRGTVSTSMCHYHHQWPLQLLLPAASSTLQ